MSPEGRWKRCERLENPLVVVFSSFMSCTWSTDGRKMSLKLVDYILFPPLDQMVKTDSDQRLRNYCQWCIWAEQSIRSIRKYSFLTSQWKMDNFFFLILIRLGEARQQILGSGSWSPFLDLIAAPSFNISVFWLPVCLYWNIIRAVLNRETKTYDSPSKLDRTSRPEERKVRGWDESKDKKWWELGTFSGHS